MGHSDRRVAEIQEGQLSQEKVHGVVELGIHPYHQQQHQVPHKGQDINNKEQHKEQSLDLGVSRQPEEDELRDNTVVSHCLQYFLWNARKKSGEVSSDA